MFLFRSETLWERSLNILRLPVATLLAFVVTILLFYLMQSLIESGEKVDAVSYLGRIVEFTRIKEEQFVETKRRRPEPPPLPDELPKIIQPRVQTIIDAETWSNVFKPLDTTVEVSSSLNFRSSGDYLPILKVQPMYPYLALQRQLVGWVLVEFTVDEIGKVVDPVVLDHCVKAWRPFEGACYNRPGTIFDGPALAATVRFKYRPKVIDGQTIATTGVKNMFTFELDE